MASFGVYNLEFLVFYAFLFIFSSYFFMNLISVEANSLDKRFG